MKTLKNNEQNYVFLFLTLTLHPHTSLQQMEHIRIHDV